MLLLKSMFTRKKIIIKLEENEYCIITNFFNIIFYPFRKKETMNTDILKFTGTCKVSYFGHLPGNSTILSDIQLIQIRRMIPEVIAETDKILTDFQNFEKENNGQNLKSDII